MPASSNVNFYNLRQGTKTGPQYVTAFERAYNAAQPPPSYDDAKARLFYGANEKVQKAVLKKMGFDDGAELVNWGSLADIKDAIKTTANPAYRPPQPAPATQPAAAPQPYYYYPVAGGSLFHGTTGPVGTINPGWWPQ